MLLTALILFFLSPGMMARADQDLADIVVNALPEERKLMVRWYRYHWFSGRNVCTELARNIRNDISPDRAYSCKNASLILLAMRATFDVDDEVINTLLDNITYRDRSISGQTRFTAPHEDYPALMALIRIGSRARDQIFLRIKQTDETKVLEQLGYWFTVQYGKKYSVMIIDDYITSSKLTNIEMKRLEKVRGYCQQSGISIP